MSNVDFRRGLQPVKTKTGAPPYVTRLPLKDSYGTNIYVGQIVTWDASGFVKAGATTNPSDIVGVSAEFYSSSGYDKDYINVWTANDHIFKAQSDGSKATTEATMMMMNAIVTGNGGGSTDSGLSTCEINVTSAGNTTTMNDFPIRIVGKSGEIGNAWSNTNVDLLVEFNPYAQNLKYQTTWA